MHAATVAAGSGQNSAKCLLDRNSHSTGQHVHLCLPHTSAPSKMPSMTPQDARESSSRHAPLAVNLGSRLYDPLIHRPGAATWSHLLADGGDAARSLHRRSVTPPPPIETAIPGSRQSYAAPLREARIGGSATTPSATPLACEVPLGTAGR
jgi:hypothetical protein